MTNEERKSFQNLPGNENPHFLEDGKRMYHMLRSKYPKDNVEHLDNILNALCAALICVIKAHVAKDNAKAMVQLVYKILDKNL